MFAQTNQNSIALAARQLSNNSMTPDGVPDLSHLYGLQWY